MAEREEILVDFLVKNGLTWDEVEGIDQLFPGALDALVADCLRASAERARDEALRDIRAEFQETYGAFWKCAECGRYLGPACSPSLVEALEGTMQPDFCPDHPKAVVKLIGYRD